MKKAILLFCALLMTGSVFASQKFNKKQQGTYIPCSLYEAVTKTCSYYKGIKESHNGEYTVLCIKDDDVLSNNQFHDAYVLNPDEIDFSFKNKNKNLFLIDNKTKTQYIKISDSTDYYTSYDLFLIDTVIKDIIRTNPDVSYVGSTVIIGGKDYKIDKDQFHYSGDADIVLYSASSYEYTGFFNGQRINLKAQDGSLELIRALLDEL